MDPITLAIIMLCTFVMVIKCGNEFLSLPKSGPSVLDYDKRWEDDKYVAMIHATRDQERNLDIELTPCECKTHNPPPKPIPPKGSGGGSRNIFKPNQAGYRGPWPKSVPDYAAVKTWYNACMLCDEVQFKWTDADGRQKAHHLKITDGMQTNADFYEIHSDQYEKPVVKWQAKQLCLNCNDYVTDDSNMCYECETNQVKQSFNPPPLLQNIDYDPGIDSFIVDRQEYLNARQIAKMVNTGVLTASEGRELIYGKRPPEIATEKVKK